MIVFLGLAILYSMTILWYFYDVNGRLVYPTACNWFLLINGMVLIGTFMASDPARYPSDLKYVATQVVGTFAFVIGCFAANLLSRTTPSREYCRFRERPVVFDIKGMTFSVSVVYIGLISLAVSAAFAYELGYHVLLTSFGYLQSQTGNTEEVGRLYSQLRTDPHYGERYLFIGYVTQFKDYLLPAVTFLWFARAAVLNHKFDWIVATVLIPLNVYLLTITGKRSPVLMFALIFAFLMSNQIGLPQALIRHGKKLKRLAIVILALAFTLFAATTALRGWISTESSGLEMLLSSFSWLIWRMGTGLAEAKIQLMRILFDQPITWGGYWWDSLATITPGHETGPANEFHNLLYGSERGAVGLQFWESAWLSFGWIGIVMGGAILGFVLQMYTIRYFRGPREVTRIVLLLILGLYLGSFTEPYGLFAGGAVAIAMLYAIVRIIKRLGGPRERIGWSLSPLLTGLGSMRRGAARRNKFDRIVL